MVRRAVVSVAVAFAAMLAAAPAVAQNPGDPALWQTAANDSRLTLLMPTPPPGFALSRINVRSPACDGQASAQVTTVLRRGDGAVISIAQHDGFCGQMGDTYLGDVQVRGVIGAEAAIAVGGCVSAPDAAPCVVNLNFGTQAPDGRTLAFTSGGVEVVIGSNLAGVEPLVALADAAVPVAPAAGLGPLFERFRARVVKVITADRLRVRVNGGLRTIRLAGLRAPRAGECWAPQSRRVAGRLFAARALWFEDDPRAGRQFWAFSGPPGARAWRDPLNSRLVAAGVAKRAVGRWRYELLYDQRSARSSKRGLWGKRCRGSFTPPPPPKPRPVVPSRPAPTAPTPARPARTDVYNCDDFPLADGTTAQDYLRLYPDDPSGLDGNNDGVACESS